MEEPHVVVTLIP